MSISFSDLRDPSLLGVNGTIASLDANFSQAAARADEIHHPSQTPQSLTEWVLNRADPNPLVGNDRAIALDLARDKAAAMSADESVSICVHLIDAMGGGRVSPADAKVYLLIIGDIVEARGHETVSGTPPTTLSKEVGDKLASTTGAFATMFQANPHITSAIIPADPDCFGLGLRVLSNLANQGQTAAVQSAIRPHIPILTQFAMAEPALDPDGRFRTPSANFLEAAGELDALHDARLAQFETEIRFGNARPDMAKIVDFIDNSGVSIDLIDAPISGGVATYGQLLSRALHIDLAATRTAGPSANAQKLADFLGDPTNFASLDAAARDDLLRAHMKLAANGGSIDFLVDNISQVKDVIDVSAMTPREQLRELENLSAVVEMKLAQAPGIKGRNLYLLDDARMAIVESYMHLLSADPIVGSTAAQQLCALAHNGNNSVARRAFYNQMKTASPAMAVMLADALNDAVEGGVVKREDLDMKALKQAQAEFGKIKRFGDYRWFNKDADPDTKEANRLIRSLRKGEPEEADTTSPTPTPSGRRSFGAWLADQATAALQFGKKVAVFGLKVAAVAALGTLAAGAGSALMPLVAGAGLFTFSSASALAAASTIASACTGLLAGGIAARMIWKRR